MGSYWFRHLRKDLLTGYRRTLLAGGHEAFVATPEKALLDLLYLEPDADTEEYLNELRLQHMEALDLGELRHLAEQFGKPKLLRAAERVARLAEQRFGPSASGTGLTPCFRGTSLRRSGKTSRRPGTPAHRPGYLQ